MTLSFLDFETESSSDILKVYEGPNVHGSLIDTYSGDNTPSPIVSNGNNMYLRFTSDSYTTYRGFKIGISGKYQYYYTMIKIISENTKMIYLLILYIFDFSLRIPYYYYH